ncbi:aspartate:alanine exchanger family transporter [Aminobacter sp. HY435]|uniref:aspartate:alanine exchanger family transporter n=1 Tax=Aminobacter sp. HY435 TaxID=2970917 RepID=UPI0022B96814|nr:transporter [Aminobacter sp. HY435]
MIALLQYLADYPYVLLFLVVGLAVWIGGFTFKGYGLGSVAGAIVVGAGLSAFAAAFGVTYKLDEFTKSLFYYLFMYGVGLRVGPSFLNSLNAEAFKYVTLAVLSCITALAITVIGVRYLNLPMGTAGGILAGSNTMSAAIGSAQQAISSGIVVPPAGTTEDQVSAMIALSYGITYIWGTVGIVMLCKYLPRWWGLDARVEAKRYETEHGVANVDDPGITGFQPFGMRAYRLVQPETAGQTIHQFRVKYPQYRILNVRRGDELLGADPNLVLKLEDVVALGGTAEDLTSNMGIIGPEVPGNRVLNIPIDQAEILVTRKDMIGKKLGELRSEDLAGQIQLTRLERAGHPQPIGRDFKLQRRDVLYVTGLKPAVDEAARILGVVARHNTSTDLVTLSFGMILGFLIGAIQFPAFGASIGLGNAGGLLLSGIIVSSISSRLRYFGNTPNAARNILEDMGLLVFVAIVGVNAGAGLTSQITGDLALKILLVGFLACTIPPIIVWMVGYYVFRMNAALLMGATAGARSHSGPAREAAKEADSNVPWLGFPVAYAVSGVLLTVGGYFAMLLAH